MGIFYLKIDRKGDFIMGFTITPEVNSSQEFIEIAQDFSNPLDLVREGISNGFDAHAKI